MTGGDIITRFELQVDDSTELSSTEELAILNRVYRKVLTDRPWEFLKKEHSTTTDGSDYITLPSDFQYVIQNGNYTDSSYEAERPVVFIGSNYDKYELVSWSDRRQYRDSEGYCYVDPVNSRLYFTKAPDSGLSVEFDYIFIPQDLTTSSEPVFPTRFHEMLVFAMAVEDSIIQQSDKAKSYAGENEQMRQSIFEDMCFWNSNLIQM